MNEYLVIASKQGVAILAGAVITYLINLVKAKKKELEEKDKALASLNENDLAQLRMTIVNTYYLWLREKYIPPLVLEGLEMAYSRYKALGGNSFISTIMDKARKLPIKEVE